MDAGCLEVKENIINFNGKSMINVREYRRDTQKWTIQRNWSNMVHKTNKNKTKTQHNMYWTPLYVNKYK